MFFKPTIAHITGSQRVLRNYIHFDLMGESRKRYTIPQMFSKPYETKEEAIFCARHTVTPLLVITTGIFLTPYIFAILPALFLGAAALFMAIGAVSKFFGKEDASTLFFTVASNYLVESCQTVIDLMLLPVAALMMITRGISTGLHAAGALKAEQSSNELCSKEAYVA